MGWKEPPKPLAQCTPKVGNRMLFITVQDKTDGALTAILEFISLEKMELWSNQGKRNYARYFKQKEFNRVISFTNNKGYKSPTGKAKFIKTAIICYH